MPDYSPDPADRRAYTRSFDRAYGRVARIYDAAVKLCPVWRRWLRRTLPHLRGPRVLEVSFGTGYVLTQYAGTFEAHGIDYNEAMVAIAPNNVRKTGGTARLARADVQALPYKDESFDSIVCTMAFSGYPDAERALAEMTRVLKQDGRLILVDVNYPADGNWLGTRLTKAWQRAGDLIRDMGALFRQFSLEYTDQEIGGWGSIHLYVATRGA